MLAYWDTDLNKSVDFFLNPICILLVVCTSTIAVCIAIYANKILFKLRSARKLNAVNNVNTNQSQIKVINTASVVN